MYDLLEKCREKLNSTFSYIISIFGDGLKKRVIYHLRLKRIYDRVLERSMPVCVSENDIRKERREEAKEKFVEILQGGEAVERRN